MSTTIQLSDVSVAKVHDTRPDSIIKENHYLRSTPAGATHRFLISGGLMHGIIGAAMWGRPVARNVNQSEVRELTRFWTADRTPKNTESWALSRMMNDVLTDSKRLIAYASVWRHEGTVYRATNWVNMGLRWPSGSWENRGGRVDRDLGVKWRFEYW